MVNMKMHITLNTKDFTKTDYSLRYGKKSRAIIKAVATNLEQNLKREMVVHDAMGTTMDSIQSIPGRNGWERIVEFSRVLEYLDQGTEPHAIPDYKAEMYAKYYGMSAKQFWYNIWKNGTKAYGVIRKARAETDKNIVKIIRNELKKK